MKDSSKLLNFNINRKLGFSELRQVDIELNRNLNFNLDRNLSFNLNRELDIRMKGVVFRAYVCPNCNTQVMRYASRCDGCGVEFEVEKQQPSNSPVAPQRTIKRFHITNTKFSGKTPTTRHKKRQPQTRRREIFGCPNCGTALYVGTSRCSKCNMIFRHTAKSMSERSMSSDSAIYCSYCGYPMSANSSSCSRCNAPRASGAIQRY